MVTPAMPARAGEARISPGCARWRATAPPVRLISLRLGRPDSAIRAKASELGLTLSNAEPVVAPPPVRTLTRTPRAPAPQGDLFAHA